MFLLRLFLKKQDVNKEDVKESIFFLFQTFVNCYFTVLAICCYS